MKKQLRQSLPDKVDQNKQLSLDEQVLKDYY